jgi:hypothetical protein
VLAGSAFFRGLIAERWTEADGGEVGERPVLEVELPAGVSGSFFGRLLRSFYGGPQLTRLQLIAAQADLAALQQMAPTIATTFDAAATAATDATDDDAIDTAADVIDDTASTDESKPATTTEPTPPASWRRKLRGWLWQRGEAADRPPTEAESLPQQRHGRPQPPPSQDHQPLPPLVAWALACLLPYGADAGGEEDQEERQKKRPKKKETEEEAAEGGGGAVRDPLEAHMRAMVDNPLFSDVAFVVGGRTIRAHKAVLVPHPPHARVSCRVVR